MDGGSLLSSKQNCSCLLNGVEQRISSHGMTSEACIICFACKSYLSRLLVNSVTNRYQMSCMLLVLIGVFCIEGKTN